MYKSIETDVYGTEFSSLNGCGLSNNHVGNLEEFRRSTLLLLLSLGLDGLSTCCEWDWNEQDEDDEVRQSTAQALELFVARELGCKVMIQEGTFAALVECLTDRVQGIRDACYRALVKSSKYQCVAECLVSMGTTLKRILDFSLNEEKERCSMGLQILTLCTGVSLCPLYTSMCLFADCLSKENGLVVFLDSNFSVNAGVA